MDEYLLKVISSFIRKTKIKMNFNRSSHKLNQHFSLDTHLFIFNNFYFLKKENNFEDWMEDDIDDVNEVIKLLKRSYN